MIGRHVARGRRRAPPTIAMTVRVAIAIACAAAALPARAQEAPARGAAEPIGSVPGPVEATSRIEQARARYDEAAFEAVLEELARAEAATLDRDAVIALLLLRALTHHAMGSTDAMRLDLERVAYLEPDLVPPSEFPPSMRRALEEARVMVEPMRLLGDIERVPRGVRFSARPSGDPRGLIRRVDAECRHHAGPWRRGESGVVSLRAAEGAVVECVAALIGPGGATLATRGTHEEPLRMDVGALETAPAGDDALPFALAGIGVGVAAVIAAVLVYVLAPPTTSISAPSL